MEKLQNEFSSCRWGLELYVCGLMSLLYIHCGGSSGGNGHWLVFWPFPKATTVSSYQTETTVNSVALFGFERYRIWTCSVESTQARTVDCWCSPQRRRGGDRHWSLTWDWSYSSQPCICSFPIIVHGLGVSQKTGGCRLGEINWRGLHLFSYGEAIIHAVWRFWVFLFLIIFQSPLLLPDPFPYLISSPEKHIVFPGCALRESFFGKDFRDPLRRGRYCLCHPREEMFSSYTFQVWVVGSAG